MCAAEACEYAVESALLVWRQGGAKSKRAESQAFVLDNMQVIGYGKESQGGLSNARAPMTLWLGRRLSEAGILPTFVRVEEDSTASHRVDTEPSIADANKAPQQEAT